MRAARLPSCRGVGRCSASASRQWLWAASSRGCGPAVTRAPPPANSAPAAAGTWSRRTAYVVGAKDPREILIYSGSEDVKNYRIEFAWVPDARGVGWLFRGTDSANYYAANLRLIQGGATPMLSAEHFAVVKGVEGTHARKVITLGRTSVKFWFGWTPTVLPLRYICKEARRITGPTSGSRGAVWGFTRIAAKGRCCRRSVSHSSERAVFRPS